MFGTNSNTIVLLNGKEVSFSEVDPIKHKFIGTFRKPLNIQPGCCIACNCGQVLKSIDEAFSHWCIGHFDMLQYGNI